MENTSGQGNAATVPAEIDRWNWGAFFLNWIWGIGNNTYIALLMFVPLVNFVMPFVLGAKGSSWAWRNKKWESIEDFKAIQRKWARWSAIVIVLVIVGFAGLIFATMSAIKSSDAFKLAEAKVNASALVQQSIGTPISTGMPSGSIETSGLGGKAEVSFGVEGPKGKGTIYFEAAKTLGEWKLNQIVFEQADGQRFDLTK